VRLFRVDDNKGALRRGRSGYSGGVTGPATGLVRNLDGLRRGNLSAVLGLVHRLGGVSRSQITQITGLNRSTVAALVGELVELQLAVEGNPETLKRVGRPSPVVTSDPRTVAIAVNPEVDAITVGIVGLGARVVQRVRREVDHPVSAEETATIVAELRDELAPQLAGCRVVGVGLAVPGLVRSFDDAVRWAPHLEWTDSPLVELVEASTGLPARAGNDASLGGWAEHLFGVGQGIDDLIYLNGGASGIGGGVIAGGTALGGHNGFAGEFGQNRVGVADRSDLRSATGTLEDEVSRARLLDVLGLPGGDEAALEAALLRSASSQVREEVARQRRVLAVALSNAVNLLNPELVVLGGFLASLHALDPDRLERDVAEHAVAAAWEGTRIRPAALGEDRLMIGAAELAFSALLADPAADPAEYLAQRGVASG
jgi:predicted NBD/HSP70 family sugar kinase